MNGESKPEISINVRIRSKELCMPPVRNALVFGKDCPIGCEAWRKALKVLQPEEFHHIELAPDDDVLSDILIRASVLKKIPEDKLVEIILCRFKPVMDRRECLHLQITTELLSEDQI